MNGERVSWAEGIEQELGDPIAPPPETFREEGRVKKADGWTVTVDEGYTFGVDAASIPWDLRDFGEPQPGDEIIVYTVRGSEVIGVELRGRRLYLRSEREVNLKRLLFRAELHRQRREEFARKKDDLDAEYERLPAVLKARIDRFREADPEFRAESEGYEMAAVADAPKIARALSRGYTLTPDGFATRLSEDEAERIVNEFREKPWDEQRELVPGLNEGHSGNTFGAATMLAYRLLTGQEC